MVGWSEKCDLASGLMHANQLALRWLANTTLKCASTPQKTGRYLGKDSGGVACLPLQALERLFICIPFLLDVVPRGRERTRLAQTRNVGSIESDTLVFHVALGVGGGGG